MGVVSVLIDRPTGYQPCSLLLGNLFHRNHPYLLPSPPPILDVSFVLFALVIDTGEYIIATYYASYDLYASPWTTDKKFSPSSLAFLLWTEGFLSALYFS